MSDDENELPEKRQRGPWIVVIIGLVFVGGFFLVQEIRERLLESRIRNALLHEGTWDFSCPSFERRTKEVDLAAVAETIRIRSFTVESQDPAWACSDAIAIQRVGSSDPWMTFCWDEMVLGDGNTFWIIEFVDDAAYRNLVKVSPWTKEEYEAALPGMWDNIHGQ